MANESAPADPYDLDAIRTVPSPHIETQKILLVSVKERPGKHQFFRTHPDPAYSTEWYTLTYESETSDREIYWVAPSLWGTLSEYTTRVRLYTCIDRQKNLFLWPCKLPDEDSNSTSRKWAQSRLQAAEEAKNLWIRIAGNKVATAYDRVVAQAKGCSQRGARRYGRGGRCGDRSRRLDRHGRQDHRLPGPVPR
jgi:hypothetical protein